MSKIVSEVVSEVTSEKQQFEAQKKTIERNLARQSRVLARSRKKWEVALQAASRWEIELHEAELLKSNQALFKRGQSSLTVWDWESQSSKTLEVLPLESAQTQIQDRFRQVKKHKIAIPHLQKQLEKVMQFQAQLIEKVNHLQTLTTLTDLEPFLPSKTERKRASSKAQGKLPYREYTTPSGLKIWVGRDAASNDRLTFQLANGLDWWLHISGYSGSHVVVRLPKGEEPHAEALNDAAQLALYHSKARQQGEGEVCITQRKYVKRCGKELGKVSISQCKTCWVKLDQSRIRQFMVS